MSVVTQPGVTGRKPRGGDADRPAGTAPPAADPTPPVPDVAPAGTATQAGQAAEQPVVLGVAPVPVEPGGPGAGAAQVAERTEATVTRPLDPAAERDLGLRPFTEADRAELERLRALEAGGALGSGVVVDASKVPGRRLARAATAVRHDGVLYGPDGERRWVPVDFAAYTALAQIGAITATPWHELETV